MKAIQYCSLLVLFVLASSNLTAQDKKYVGEWQLVESPFKDKCAKQQTFILRKDGTATYIHGSKKGGCKEMKQEYKSWGTKQETVKRNGKKVSITVLIIGEHKDIMFYIMNKKGKRMEVVSDSPSGDTTRNRKLVLEKV